MNAPHVRFGTWGIFDMAKQVTAPGVRPDQWHLLNEGQTGGTAGVDINVIPVWVDYRGEGIKIAVLDSGVDSTHPDLAPNYLSDFDYDFLNEQPDGSVLTQPVFDPHGTFVSGLIAASGENGGIRGVAYEAQFTSYANFNGDRSYTAFQKAADDGFDVMNNSWGNMVPFAQTFVGLPQLEESVRYAVDKGRGGLGLNIVFAAGNSFGRNPLFEKLGYEWSGDFPVADTNMASLQNSRFTITVASIDHNGTYGDGEDALGYSTPGASVLVSAPGTAVESTDIQGDFGYNAEGGTAISSGTSFAAPVVSGVVALMLEANPLLGYRDVKEILAHSAAWNDQIEPDWIANGAITHNGGGLMTNINYGFGMVDATAAVRLAETWHKQSTLANEAKVKSETMMTPTAITDNGAVEFTFTLADGVSIETMELDFMIEHQEFGDLVITLVSPDGLESPLISRVADGRATELSTAFYATLGEVYPTKIIHTFTSNEFMGESSGGVWTLRVEDAKAGNTGTVEALVLRAYGSGEQDDQTYIFTNDFAASVEMDAGRAVISNTVGQHTLNFAAVSDAITLNLAQGQGMVDGQALTIAADTTIARIFSGDGNDLITLAASGGIVDTGRGHDTIEVSGSGTVDGGAGIDRISLSSMRSDYAISQQDEVLKLVKADGTTLSAQDVQYLGFAGGDALVLAANAFEARVASFYETLFDRAADFEGIAYWLTELQSGIDAGAIASSFAASTEFASRYDGFSTADFVDFLYGHILEREADADGAAYWTNAIETGVDRKDIAVSFAMSEEAGTHQFDHIFMV